MKVLWIAMLIACFVVTVLSAAVGFNAFFFEQTRSQMTLAIVIEHAIVALLALFAASLGIQGMIVSAKKIFGGIYL